MQNTDDKEKELCNRFKALSDYVDDYVLLVLEACQGNRTVAARVLGISYRGLKYRLSEMRKQGIELPVSPGRPTTKTNLIS